MNISHRKLARTIGLGVLLACVAMAALGCSSTQVAQRPLDTSFIVLGKTTKTEVYQGLGLPDTLFFPGYPIKERKWYYKVAPKPNVNTVGEGQEVASALVYAPVRGEGKGLFLAGSIASSLFRFGHHHVAGDTLLILLDANNQVIGVHELAKADDVMTHRLWPFGS